MYESLDQLAGSKWFSLLDLSSAFWQLPLAERSRLHSIHDQNTRSAALEGNANGVKNASAAFQREIDAALGSLRLTCCIAHIDDVHTQWFPS